MGAQTLRCAAKRRFDCTASTDLTLSTTRQMLQRSLLVPAFLLVLVAGCASNRRATQASIPAPLVTALLDDRGSATRAAPEYTVNSLPPGYPATLIPSGPVRIVGGMTSGDQIVAVFADSTRRLAAIFEQLFEHGGFTRPAPAPGSGFSSGVGPYSFSCKDSAMVSVEPLTGSARNFARVSYRRVGGRYACPTPGPAPSQSQLHLPELKPPTGVYVAHSSGGSNRDGVNSSAEMSGTALVASAILAHYSAQLVATGWTAAAPAISENVAAQFFEVKDSTGALWQGVLMVVGSGAANSVSLSMHPRKKP